MPTNYELHIPPQLQNQISTQESRQGIDQIIESRNNAIECFEIKNPDNRIKLANDNARIYLIKIFKEAGVELNPDEIPPVYFVSGGQRSDLASTLHYFYGGSSSAEDFRKMTGFESVWNNPVVFVNREDSGLDVAVNTFHELYHAISQRFISETERGPQTAREGLAITNVNSPYNSWVLEEGLVAYDSKIFLEELAKRPEYAQDVAERRRLYTKYERRGKIRDGKVVFKNGLTIAPEYCVVQKWRNLFGLVRSRFVSGNSMIAGTLVEFFLNQFSEQDRQDLLKLLRQAKRNVKLTGQIAKKINDKFGENAYQRVLRCPERGLDIWNLFQEFKNVGNQ